MAKPPKSKQRARNPDRRGTPRGKGTRSGKGGGGKIGNPPFEPTEEQRKLVLSHAAVATPHPIIAEEIGISLNTLYRYFQKELDDGLPIANSRLGGVLYKKALNGDMRAIEQWYDRRGGPDWKKKTGLEVSGVNGEPVRYEDLSRPADFSKLPLPKRRQLEKLLLEAEAGRGDEPS